MPDSEPGPWIRLSPFSPYLKAGRTGIVILVILVQQGLWGVEALAGLGVLFIAVVVALGLGVLSWQRTTYRLSADHLDYQSGVLSRDHRRVPFARIEAVDVAQQFIPRLFGLAEVRVQAAASDDSELKLQYLSATDAWALRDRLRVAARALTQGETEAGAEVGEMTPEETGQTLFTVSNADLFFGYLVARVTAPLLFLLLGVGVVVSFEGRAALGGLFSFFLGLVGLIYAGLKSTESLYNFTLYEHPEGLFIHRGLLNTLTQRVTLDRVQSIALQEPFLWRRFGRARLLIDVAGYRSRDGNEAEQTTVLVPIASRAACVGIMTHVMPGFTVPQFRRPPRSARWLDPWGRRYLGLAASDQYAVSVHGIVRRLTVVVPHRKVQSWRLMAGPIQRRLGLVSVALDTAGSRLSFVAPHRAREDARSFLGYSREQANRQSRP